MRILKKEISAKNGAGYVRLQADDNEDMWHLYNLITENDVVRASTVRNVVRESNTGSTSKNRVKMMITIRVERVEFDSEHCSLRLVGRNVEENEFVKMGQYHTVDLEANQPLRLEKSCWDVICLDRLEEAADPAAKADMAAVVMQEGLAHICLVTSSMTITRARIERRMPKKGQLNQAHSKALAKFLEDIYDAIKKHINFDIVRVVLVGSPGFLKDDFMNFLNDTAVRRGDTVLVQNKSKFLRVNASSGHKNAIEQVLASSEVRSQLNDVKAVAEVRALERFYSTLSSDEDRAAYGFKQVLHADEHLAIDELLVTDKLFQAADVVLRQQYVSLVESVREHGGKVYVFSSMHVSGEQLDQYTGVAATLRFPLVQPQETDSEDEEEEAPPTESLVEDEFYDDFVGERRRRLSSVDDLDGCHIDMGSMGLVG
mmetsp:Transcript_17224/g.25761  ORF Transcript_17224/g.25761 Transcript_17224/m.25761 type:complete len:429 (-) Transcript_17224:138-1424(-)|eukprot:CAMPEP_0185036798 /NCGR_PEP_ID=MMETSP1103-20130426/30271_1 /TAXON_ID=36769 /ORGANISM="Paraphysomonas bandaiensis, Strain Caron Lab Isolate" /LENGTH=428 /DNA_ID=CAMNT_0027574477 /DNA_START=119 /DNA_END=1405 /DNA_ORIENTATION=-